jgi:hypothetical protein
MLRRRREEKESEFSFAGSLSSGSKIEFYVFVTDLSSSENTPPLARMKKTKVTSNRW